MKLYMIMYVFAIDNVGSDAHMDAGVSLWIRFRSLNENRLVKDFASWLLLQQRRPVEQDLNGRIVAADDGADNEPLAVRRHIVRWRARGSLSGKELKQRGRRTELTRRRPDDWNGHQRAVGRDIEQLLAVASPSGGGAAAR